MRADSRVDRVADQRLRRLAAVDPLVDAHCAITSLVCDVSSGEFAQGGFLGIAGASSAVTHPFVCLDDDDVRAAAAALSLQAGMRDRGLDGPVVVRLFDMAGVASVFPDRLTMGAAPMVPFALADWSCQREVVIDQRTELVARTLQRIYTRQCEHDGDTPSQNPAMGDWARAREEDREGCRDQAASVDRLLRAVGAVARSVEGWDGEPLLLEDDEVERLARCEHDRWWAFKRRSGYRWGHVSAAMRFCA